MKTGKLNFLLVLIPIILTTCMLWGDYESIREQLREKNRKDDVTVPVITIKSQTEGIIYVTIGEVEGSLFVEANVTGNIELGYQWFENSAANNLNGEEIEGETDSSFDIPEGLTEGTYYYFCEISTEGAVSVRSKVMTVMAVNEPVITIDEHPAEELVFSVGLIEGSLSVTARVTAGATLSYQWYSNTENSNVDGTVIDGATNANFIIPTTLTAGTYYYYCIVSDAGGAAAPAVSNVARVEVSVASHQRGISITFDHFSDIDEPQINIGTIHLYGEVVLTYATITVTNPGQYDPSSIKWYFNDIEINNGVSGEHREMLTVSSSVYSNIGQYIITVEVKKDGKLYSKNVSFEVRP